MGGHSGCGLGDRLSHRSVYSPPSEPTAASAPADAPCSPYPMSLGQVRCSSSLHHCELVRVCDKRLFLDHLELSVFFRLFKFAILLWCCIRLSMLDSCSYLSGLCFSSLVHEQMAAGRCGSKLSSVQYLKLMQCSRTPPSRQDSNGNMIMSPALFVKKVSTIPRHLARWALYKPAK